MFKINQRTKVALRRRMSSSCQLVKGPGVWAFGDSWKAELSGVLGKDIHSAPAKKIKIVIWG